jgi:acyl dehydratase
MMYFEDIEQARREEIGSFTFTSENIKSFARRFDPQPFHVDDEAAKASLYGGLIASGWQVAAIWMKLTVEKRLREQARARAEGRAFGQLGPSPGFRNMVWARPVRPGDTLTYYTTITAKKASASRPGWGIVTMHNESFDQSGTRAFAFDGAVFSERRPAS